MFRATYFASATDPAVANSLALSHLGSTLTQEASLLATLDDFWALSRFSGLMLAIILLKPLAQRGWAWLSHLVAKPATRG
jgi:hypothetical protein